jgi:Flp pilus assembly protein TadG
MAHTAPKNLKQFQCDERGTIALIFALTVFILFWCAGLAIDGGRAYAVNSRMTRAVDAAALAAARGMRLDNLTDDKVTAVALQYFKSNFEAGGGDVSQLNWPPPVFIDRVKGSVEIDATARVPTTFGAVGGIDFINVAKTSVAIFSATDYEVSLQLDLTGSMGDLSGDGVQTKVEALRGAAADFINIMMPDVPTGQKVRIGLAPFDAGVNAGAYLTKVNAVGVSVRNCAFERYTTTNQTTDAPPSNSSDELKVFKDIAASNNMGPTPCPKAEVVALTDDKKFLLSEVTDADKYTDGVSTAGHLGTAWAYYLLSPRWNNVWQLAEKPAEYKDGKTQKVAVLMTDGVYNTVSSKMSSANEPKSQKFAIDTCAAMKADGIIIYTVGFQAPADAQVLLAKCASDPAKALNADNGAQLKSAFKNIANQITTLRLSQ